MWTRDTEVLTYGIQPQYLHNLAYVVMPQATACNPHSLGRRYFRLVVASCAEVQPRSR